MTTKSKTLVGRASSAVALLTVVLSLLATAPSSAFAQSSSDPQFKVQLNFNRWHDYDELKVDLLRLEDAFPQFLEYQSIGTTAGGRDMMLMTINNPETGPVKSKAAMFIDGNMHGNEIQAGEVCMYTIWYLMENYGRIEKVTQLVDERVFFIMPTVNPDGRDFFMDGTGQGGRTGHVPVDDDNDGLFDEDGPEDLNGSGAVEQIRKYVPGQGTHRISHRDPRIMEPVPAGAVTTCCLATRVWTTTVMEWSTRTARVATTRTETGVPVGSRAMSKTVQWTIRFSCRHHGPKQIL